MKLNLDPSITGHKMDKNIKNLKKQDLKEAEDKKLKAACADFESLFLEMMLKSMRDTLPGDSIFDKGLADDIYQSMHDQKLSENIAHGNNNLGLGDSLYRQLTRNKPENIIKNKSAVKADEKTAKNIDKKA